ncbi:prolipoprotein diacylglyceryl transferase [Elizabethkingia meningoseptica]|nr:prolipoprotein diacylglyceryl transferase [Elizabethkingia meningoseptica]EOR30964.1 prolipoprotein diacylglyceryl transferase [Elizabethkingia meningoseptica ATCC 13253 = NBRC 12535]EJK5327570.1 prolipoprotein diacylglyceryl transferase [Elizabethkingia meningoseptica]MDE5467205.1 prolipoprotein diacylglyceryl transferase [Elizabethkingia meningoseptica]MDE5473565.1 prolipoprotein diacylglyceryl transferase [Elizabethkingia meningoseptica]MDE5476998.1 prolipoprotein diacylglyceryl transfer
MNNILLRIYLFVFALFAQGLFSQNYSDGLSDGTVVVNQQKKIPVKIFATTSGKDFGSFAQNNLNNNILIILNSAINEYAATPVFDEYKTRGYQLLDKDFQPVNPNNVKDFKYFYKPSNPQNNIEEGAKAKLETAFKIWDPSVGIKLGPITLHFYSLMFVFAFGFGYILMKKIFKIDGVDQKYLDPLFTWTLIGTILGARLGHVIFYQPELFKQDFWSVFLPIQTKPEFKFTGFSGLASHGATIALILTTLYYSFKIVKKNPFWVYDRLGIVVALGGAFVRMGNFFNSEIIGKPVAENSPFAILFPQQSSEYGVTVPRYPSQLFEAIGYVLLFVLLWFLYRKTDKKYQQGWLFGLFFIILWAIRFFVEFLKEPQGDEFIQFGGLNTGQVLSIPFMIAGFAIMLYSKKNKLAK